MNEQVDVARRPDPALVFSVIAFLIAAAALGVVLYRVIKERAAFAPYTAVEEHAPDHILVRFKPGTPAETIRSVNAGNRSQQTDILPAIGVRVMTVAPGKTASEMVDLYANNPNVDFAELDIVAKLVTTPNDPFYSYDATPFGRINAPSGWDISTGSSAVRLAVLDTGIDFTHPEFAGRTVTGYDFVNNDTDPSDDHGHGTLAAGIAAATGNNGVGVAGVDWRSVIMPVKVLDASGSGFTSVIAKGITYAADNGARVLSMSFGGGASSTMQAAIDYAAGKDCVLVAAAGNDGAQIDRYPASYPNVISVGALQGDTIASFSNWGSALDVVAPGVAIYAPQKGGGYTYFSGTSAATPFVAGLASLVLSVANQSAVVVSNEITSTATDLGAGGWDAYYGWGRINIDAALKAAGGSSTVTPPSTGTTTTPPPAPATDVTAPTVAITAPVAGSTISGTLSVLMAATDDVGVARIDLYADSTLVGSTSITPYAVAWNTAKFANGSHVLTARAFDAAGNAATAQITVSVSNVAKRKR